MKLKKLVAIDNTGVKDFIGNDLLAWCDEVIFYDDYPKDEKVMIERMADADGMLVSWNTPISAYVIESLPQLKFIGMCCTLFDEKSANVDVIAAKKQGIHVVGVKDYGDEGVVEFIISALINLFKNQNSIKFRDEAIECGGLNLGIVGLGTLGNMVAKASKHFGMNVYYHNRTEKETEFDYLSKGDLFKTCDIITTHLPRNTKVIHQEDFDQLKAYSVLINTGLSPSYDETAFINWIQKPHRFAIFDKVSLTPALIEAYKVYDNIIISDHVTGFTWNARKRLAEKVLINLKTYLEGLVE